MPSRKNVDRRAPGGVTSSNDVDKLASDLLSIEEVGELLGEHYSVHTIQRSLILRVGEEALALDCRSNNLYFRVASRSVRDESSWGTGRNRTSGSSAQGCVAYASTPHLDHTASYLLTICCASRIKWPLPVAAAATPVIVNRRKQATNRGPRPRRACR
ncbi:unnamed protein product [Sphagnum jensenii]